MSFALSVHILGSIRAKMITAGHQPFELQELFHLLHALIRSLVGQAGAGCFIGEKPNIQFLGGNITIYPTAESHWSYSARELLFVSILIPLNLVATRGHSYHMGRSSCRGYTRLQKVKALGHTVLPPLSYSPAACARLESEPRPAKGLCTLLYTWKVSCSEVETTLRKWTGCALNIEHLLLYVYNGELKLVLFLALVYLF